MRPRPGRLFEEININLSRPRDRNSALFDNFKRHVLTALDRSLDRDVPDLRQIACGRARCGGDNARLHTVHPAEEKKSGRRKWTLPNSARCRPRSRSVTSPIPPPRFYHAEGQGLDRE